MCVCESVGVERVQRDSPAFEIDGQRSLFLLLSERRLGVNRSPVTRFFCVGRETPGSASCSQSPNGGSRTPAKCALNSAVVRGEHVSARRPSVIVYLL